MMTKTIGYCSVIKNNIAKLAITFALPLLLSACGGNSGNANQRQEDATHGTIRISVDESFKPVIDSQLKVYQASYPDVHIIADYKPEAECLKDLMNDSIRMVIVTRGLSQNEVDGMKGKLSFEPQWGILAFDGVAVITNKAAKDSLFTMGDIHEMLSGNTSYKYKIVMDGVKATSTVRYAIDSILKGQPLDSKLEAAKSSPDVIDYVSKNPNAIGMIGVSWIGDRDDSSQLNFLNKVRIASIRCDYCDGQPYTKPYQANLATSRYPMRRGLYYILKENYMGVGNGLVNFMVYERGQLIFKRAYLLPARMNFDVRQASLSQ